MVNSDQSPIDQVISTPEKFEPYDILNNNATPGIRDKESTPIGDLELEPTNPFLYESKHTFKRFMKNTDDADITPLFKKLPKNDLQFNLASTPLNSQENNINEPIQFNFGKSNRNIFNLSPQSKTSQPQNETISDVSSAVKDAFNTFDKSNNYIPSTKLSTRSYNVRKRKRLSKEVKNNESLKTLVSKQRVSKNRLESKTLRQIISDPQCVSNLTIIVQVILNSMIMLLFLGFGIFAFLAIKKDVDRKIITYVNEAIYNINSCKRDYFINNCAPELRAPALERKCNEWATCMEQDPEAVITSRAYFEVFADCLNAFFHNVSLKTLCSLGCLLVFCVIMPNILFTKFRSSTTINQNYYGQSHVNDKAENVQSQTVLRGNERVNMLPTTEISRPSVGLSKLTNSTGVRFDPNVSYSFYECEDVKTDHNQPIDSIDPESLEEETEGDIGNNRILLDF
ncbi:hypothetical protein CANINC_004301 [Pichia inconspicua]|uniref:Brl1/Brr6 domain-containing protein n=1 Tax=Pichia inconspicua TaxID=52247 RepID=A0A4T0WXW1_9ASCO|nr:hypothetical protein CANINC_004301 [[Candida] inconspicua]